MHQPDLKIAAFELRVRARERPESHDRFDGNWLLVVAECKVFGAALLVDGPILMTSDIFQFREDCRSLYVGKRTSAIMDPLEPNLRIALESLDDLGHIRCVVEMTANHLTQMHRVYLDIDQSYLPSIISQCTALIEQYPVRGARA